MIEDGNGHAVVQTMLANDAFSRWLGLSVDEIGPGRATLSLAIREEMLNGFGRCHGGILSSLADSALAFAANTRAPQSMTVELLSTYHKAVCQGDLLIANATERVDGRRLAHYDVELRRNDEVVATFRGLVYRTQPPPNKGETP